MIIKGLLRRYERWNPVHPTSGAFWGIGVGVGCGVGWGPGFGPEVVGYVGAGCGVGFSVGVTLVGFGIGLPANFPFKVPYNAFTATRSCALEFARSSGLLSMRNVAGDGLRTIGPYLSRLQRGPSGKFPGFEYKNSLNAGLSQSQLKSTMSSSSESVLDHLRKISDCFFRTHKGLKD